MCRALHNSIPNSDLATAKSFDLEPGVTFYGIEPFYGTNQSFTNSSSP